MHPHLKPHRRRRNRRSPRPFPRFHLIPMLNLGQQHPLRLRNSHSIASSDLRLSLRAFQRTLRLLSQKLTIALALPVARHHRIPHPRRSALRRRMLRLRRQPGRLAPSACRPAFNHRPATPMRRQPLGRQLLQFPTALRARGLIILSPVLILRRTNHALLPLSLKPNIQSRNLPVGDSMLNLNQCPLRIV